MSKDDDQALLREVLRRRAELNAQWGHKWDAKDTVTLLILSAQMAASYEKERDKPQPPGW